MINDEHPDDVETIKEYKVVILKDGPYLVKGSLPINKVKVTFDAENMPLDYEIVETYPVKPVQSLCRCGHSSTMPFCDGTHALINFKSGEDFKLEQFYKGARKMVGRNLILYDYRELCMGVGFCHRAGSTWILAHLSDIPSKRQLAIEQAGLCPSGRLVAADKETDMPIDPDFEPSISIIDDPRFKTLFPIWLKGNVPIEAQDGTLYEIRHRVTLCSCGKSRIKPFCDGRHYFA